MDNCRAQEFGSVILLCTFGWWEFISLMLELAEELGVVHSTILKHLKCMGNMKKRTKQENMVLNE